MPCRACRKGTLTEVIDFGQMPVANRLVDPSALSKPEFRARLAVGICTSCWMLQLEEILPPAELFHANYPYFSSTSLRMEEHFQGFAEDVQQRLAGEADPLVVEIGSNDGIMLRHFGQTRVLGIEPSESVALASRARGIKTWVEFFSVDIAERIRKEEGPAHALLGANVVRHNADLHALFAAVQRVLADDGIFAFEDPALLEILRASAWDQIYDEHVYYYSVTSIAHVLAMHGLRVFDVRRQPVHGGTFRIYACHESSKRHRPGRELEAVMADEAASGLDDLSVYCEFAVRTRASRDALVALVGELHAGGKRIAGYGATAKGTIVLNYCQLGPDVVEYISDSTPAKQGRFLPGMKIPIVSPEVFHARPPDYALLLAWNHAAEIRDKESAFLANGGRFIVHIPVVAVG